VRVRLTLGNMSSVCKSLRRYRLVLLSGGAVCLILAGQPSPAAAKIVCHCPDQTAGTAAKAAGMVAGITAVNLAFEWLSPIKQALAGGLAALDSLQIVAKGKVADKQSQDMHETARQENMAANTLLAKPARTCQVASAGPAITAADLQRRVTGRKISQELVAWMNGNRGGNFQQTVAMQKRYCERYADPSVIGTVPGCAGGRADLRNVVMNPAQALFQWDTFPDASGSDSMSMEQEAAYDMMKYVVGVSFDQLPTIGGSNSGNSALAQAVVARRGDLARAGVAASTFQMEIDARAPLKGSALGGGKDLQWGRETLASFGVPARLIPKNLSYHHMIKILTHDRFMSGSWAKGLQGTEKDLFVNVVQTTSSLSIAAWQQRDAQERRSALLATLLATRVQQVRHDPPASAAPTTPLGARYYAFGTGNTLVEQLISGGMSREEAEQRVAYMEEVAGSDVDITRGITIVDGGSAGTTVSFFDSNGNQITNIVGQVGSISLDGTTANIGAIAAIEGTILNTYVPKGSDGNPHSNSGVTIDTGYDLGSKTVADLRNDGFSDSSIAALTPYLGLRGETAQNALSASGGYTISQAESTAVFQREMTQTLNQAVNVFNSNSDRTFDQLSAAEQTVVLQAVYNNGAAGVLRNGTANAIAFRQIAEGDTTGAVQTLTNASQGGYGRYGYGILAGGFAGS
jgi:hypothetical protein